MKDFLGQELNIGDKVILPNPNVWGYDGFSWGTVEKFTPKMVKIRHNDSSSGTKLKSPTSVLLMGDEQVNALITKTLKK